MVHGCGSVPDSHRLPLLGASPGIGPGDTPDPTNRCARATQTRSPLGPAPTRTSTAISDTSIRRVTSFGDPRSRRAAEPGLSRRNLHRRPEHVAGSSVATAVVVLCDAARRLESRSGWFRAPGQCFSSPAFTNRCWPVTALARSEQKNATTSATSSSAVMRCSGNPPAMSSTTSSGVLSSVEER